MIKNSKTADIALIVTAIIWGTGFIGTEYAIGTGAKTSLIIAMRFVFSGLILLAIYAKEIKKIEKQTLKIGITAGVMLFFGFYFQTLGQSNTTVSNSSFLTSTSVIMVPFLVWLVTKKAPHTKLFILAFTVLIGVGVLTLDFSSGISFQTGDLFVLLGSLCFAIHIAFLGIFARELNSKQMTFLQMMTAGVVGTIFMLIFDIQAVDFVIMKAAFFPTLYLAAFSGCVCYYLQTTAQQYASPSKAGLFLSLEGFFGCVFSVILGIDALTSNLIIGGAIILTSVILAEVDFGFFKKEKVHN
ncbi:MAG: DMT family transporter [Clostridia bacterium]